MVEPAVVVDGVGAVADPVPPVAAVNHNRLLPAAVNAVEVSFWQYTTGVVTDGGGGIGLTVTVMAALGPSQPFKVWLT